MKLHIEMSVVESCDATLCAYNQDHRCCAKAITVGGASHPACDTFISSEKDPIRGHHADPSDASSTGVGACKTVTCRHNHSLECGAASIQVTAHSAHADCATFEQR